MKKVLYGRDKQGKTKVWSIEGTEDNLVISHGQLKGKKQVHSVSVSPKGTRTMKEQVHLEFNSRVSKQRAKGYTEKLEDIGKSILPTLLKKYIGNERHMPFPCYVQPKLNGVRMCRDRHRYYSRTGKDILFKQHLDRDSLRLLEDLGGYTLDGELFSTVLDFETISAIARKTKEEHPLNQKCRYYVFDFMSTLPYYIRAIELNKLVEKYQRSRVHIVQSFMVHNRTELINAYDYYLSLGFEGIVLRNPKAPYTNQYRTTDILKLKPELEEEFVIRDIVPTGDGTVPLFILDKFNCVIKGTLAYRRSILKSKQDYIGKLLTVKFQTKNKYGIPTFGVGKGIRDYD